MYVRTAAAAARAWSLRAHTPSSLRPHTPSITHTALWHESHKTASMHPWLYGMLVRILRGDTPSRRSRLHAHAIEPWSHGGGDTHPRRGRLQPACTGHAGAHTYSHPLSTQATHTDTHRHILTPITYWLAEMQEMAAVGVGVGVSVRCRLTTYPRHLRGEAFAIPRHLLDSTSKASSHTTTPHIHSFEISA